MPGGPAELDLFGDKGFILTLDRSALDPGKDCYEAMACAIDARIPSGKIRLVAFSLGARAALEITYRLGARVGSIDLIAPAAPLTVQDRDMTGYPVFMAARCSPALFGALVRLQSAMARFAPALLYDALFRTAQGADLLLSRDRTFRAGMLKVLSRCFLDGGRAYRAEIAAYVTSWSDLPGRVGQPVTLWHGTLDNWAPIAMSERLFKQLPNAVALHRLEGLSHYSTLRFALREIAGGTARVSEDHRA